jgi:hypothetical protein
MAGQMKELSERERNPDCASYRPLSLSLNLKKFELGKKLTYRLTI